MSKVLFLFFNEDDLKLTINQLENGFHFNWKFDKSDVIETKGELAYSLNGSYKFAEIIYINPGIFLCVNITQN